MFLSPNPFSQLNLLQDLKGSLWELGGTLAKVLVEWNEWATVRNEEGSIYTPKVKMTV
jgi:hypothetical protein